MDEKESDAHKIARLKLVIKEQREIIQRLQSENKKLKDAKN